MARVTELNSEFNSVSLFLPQAHTTGSLLPLWPVGGAVAPHNGFFSTPGNSWDWLTYRARSNWAPMERPKWMDRWLTRCSSSFPSQVCEKNWQKVGQSRLIKVTNLLHGGFASMFLNHSGKVSNHGSLRDEADPHRLFSEPISTGYFTC